MRWKIFFYLCGFVGALLILLFLFQVVFLDSFYRGVKTNQIKETAYEIANQIEKHNIEGLQEDIDILSENSDYCIRIADFENGYIYKNTTNSKVCGYIGDSDIEVQSQVLTLYKKALENGGEILYTIESSKGSKYSFIDNRLKPFVETTDYMAYGKVANYDSSEYFVLVNSRITMVSEIAETIRKQLLLISGIVLVLAMGFAFFIASKISSPIIQTNEAAKKMAGGNTKLLFDSKGYKEIEELNETLNFAQTELSKVENLRNELIANISHDLRTPLTMIGGYGEIMRDIPGENTPENVQVIIDECHRLTVLVNDLLDLSKLQAKANNLTLTTFNITQVIKGIIERFSIMLKNEDYNIHFEYDNEILVNADEVKINQVIYNLLANAINYAGKDKNVTLRQINKGNSVRIEVSDHGEGISEENLPYVWDRYYKIDKVHKRPQVGTGLGLAIVKNVLELHEAIYGVESKVQEGTTFYFELKKEDL